MNLKLWIILSLALFGWLSACAPQTLTDPAATEVTPPETPEPLSALWNDPEALYFKGRELETERDFETALMAYLRVEEAFPKSPFQAKAFGQARFLQRRLGRGALKVGVILPLSERYTQFGQGALNGIACAFGLFDPCDKPEAEVQLVVRDSGSDPDQARAAATELIEKEKVAILIGPLLSATTEAVAQMAEERQTPVILLSPKEQEGISHKFVFQHTLLPENEVSFILKRIADLGIDRFLLLSPDDRYGRYYRQLFLDHLGEQGSLIDELQYPPDLPEYEGTLAQFLKRDTVRRALRDKEKRTAILIPDTYRRVVYLAEALDHLNLNGVPLIGTSRWHHPELIRQPHGSLEGAWLTAAFLAESKKEGTQRFRKMFQEAFDSEPAWLEAIGYDAGRLTLAAIAGTKEPSRKALREELKNLRDFPGALGPLNWRSDGVSEWPLEWITIQNGQFIPSP